jgi:uncharacterized protein YqeY
MLIDEIKTRMTRAMRERDEVVRNILGLAVGEIQTAEARANRPVRDDEATAIVRKLLKSNEETVALAGAEDARTPALRREIEVLKELLPKSMSAAQIAEVLAPVADAIRAAKTDGQAMGVAMKHLKSAGATADAPDVQQALKQLRGAAT